MTLVDTRPRSAVIAPTVVPKRKKRPFLLPLALMVLFLIYSIAPVWWLFVSSTKNLADLYQSFGLWFAHWNFVTNVRETLT